MERRLHIAFVLDSFRIGGTEINAVRTAEQLCAEGVRLTVFYLSDDGALRDRYEALDIEMHHAPIRNFYSPATFRQGFRLAAMIRKAGIDIAHTHDMYTNVFALPYLRLASDCMVLASRRWGKSVFPASLNFLNRFALRFAHRVLGNSNAVSDLLADVDHVPAEKIVTLPNFVDDDVFASAGEVMKDWPGVTIPADAIVAGVVARLEPVKNHKLVIRAIADTPDTVHLVVVGDGSERPKLESLVRKLGLDNRIHFLGEVPAGSKIQRHFDVCVLSSHDEGFPNSIVEAMAMGKPVIATAVGGVVDAVEDGETGVLVEPGNHSAMSDAIRSLCENAELRNKMGMAGLSIAQERYSRAAVISALMNIYRQMSAESRG
ncbi:MAG: glycosyltransferase [Gammaproteobacteria bacterium]|nr:glycosyltransferase [Gammaproteobacteria bacterium]